MCARSYERNIFPRSMPARGAISRWQTRHCQVARPASADFKLRIRHARKISLHGQLRLELPQLGERLARLIHSPLCDERDRQSAPCGGVHAVVHQRRAREPFGILVLLRGKLSRRAEGLEIIPLRIEWRE